MLAYRKGRRGGLGGGGDGEVSPALIVSIYGLNVSFEMQF